MINPYGRFLLDGIFHVKWNFPLFKQQLGEIGRQNTKEIIVENGPNRPGGGDGSGFTILCFFPNNSPIENCTPLKLSEIQYLPLLHIMSRFWANTLFSGEVTALLSRHAGVNSYENIGKHMENFKMLPLLKKVTFFFQICRKD